MKKYYVYSTIAAPMAYTLYRGEVEGSHFSDKDLSVAEKSVLIHGGHGVADRKNIVTPRGVVTEINEDDYEILKLNKVFQMHVDGGFIVVEEKKQDPEKVVDAGMNEEDESRPITPKDFLEQKDGSKKFAREKKS